MPFLKLKKKKTCGDNYSSALYQIQNISNSLLKVGTLCFMASVIISFFKS